MGVLQGTKGPARDIVCLNSGAALYAANVAGSIEDWPGAYAEGHR